VRPIKEIKAYIERCPADEIPQIIGEFLFDERKGVKNLVASAMKRHQAYLAELERLDRLMTYERAGYEKGYELIAGIDEVGRGPLAGPVVAAAVILPKGCVIAGIDDSKKLSAKKREALNDIILEKAVSFGIGVVSPERIDEINILQATYEAMRQALSALSPMPQFILADAVTIPEVPIPQEGIIKGDSKSLSIGAASIVAKVYRDKLMEQYDELYPAYGFAANKGYGSAEHIAAIRVHGICSIHRKSFVKNFVSSKSAHEKGVFGEELAAKQMGKMGYEILERNYERGGKEIDIIAKKDTYIVFAEVKYRKSRAYGLPSEAVDWKKQNRIIEAAQAYIQENELEGDFRFDVAEVLEEDGRRYFRYIENAFVME